MSGPDDIPKLRRDIEAVATVHEGSVAYVIRDNLGLIRQPVLLQGQGLEWIRLIDGQRSIRDIQLAVIRAGGNAFISLEAVNDFVAELDRLLLLDNERYRRAREDLTADFLQRKVRPAALSGRAYPDTKTALSEFLCGILDADASSESPALSGSPWALVAPHIDLEVGKRVYRRAYRSIKHLSPKRIFLLGTGHNLGTEYLSFTEKDFETPLGRTVTDKEKVRRLKAAAGRAASEDDFAHRGEHSLEFQLIFLQHLFGTGFSIIPVLLGSFRDIQAEYSRASEIPYVAPFLDLLTAFLEEEPDALVVAGVDFSHIGLKFGHHRPAAHLRAQAVEHDRRLIEALMEYDPEAFWRESRRVGDGYLVCGFSALACLLELKPSSSGRLLEYEMWDEDATRSAVGFAALTLNLPSPKNVGEEKP